MSGGSKVKVFLSGEGPNELGSRYGHPSFQDDGQPGVLQALLSRVHPEGWEVGGARAWRSIRKYKARGVAHQDTLDVLGVALDAKEAGCDVLAFSRDADKDPDRRQAVDHGIERIPGAISGAPAVIGGVAVPTLEGWILALLAVRGTESLSAKRAEETLAGHGVASKDGRAMVEVVENADLDAIPSDAASLHTWLGRARAVLPSVVAQRAGS